MLGVLGFVAMALGLLVVVGTVLGSAVLMKLAVGLVLIEIGNLLLTGWIARHESKRLW
jgi:hypothetical protein